MISKNTELLKFYSFYRRSFPTTTIYIFSQTMERKNSLLACTLLWHKEYSYSHLKKISVSSLNLAGSRLEVSFHMLKEVYH